MVITNGSEQGLYLMEIIMYSFYNSDFAGADTTVDLQFYEIYRSTISSI